MDAMKYLFVPLIIFMAVVAPMWIRAHYRSRAEAEKKRKHLENEALREMWERAGKLEERIASLEAILDAEVPGWRDK